MHIHVAAFQWKDSATRDDIERALDLVRSVQDRVTDIVGIYCGRSTSKWSKDYTDVVVVLGRTQKAIDDYRSDTVHVQAAEVIEQMELDGIGLDFVDDIQSGV